MKSWTISSTRDSRLKQKQILVELVQIKAHIGIEHNEIVDQLAKENIDTGDKTYNKLTPEESCNQHKARTKEK